MKKDSMKRTAPVKKNPLNRKQKKPRQKLKLSDSNSRAVNNEIFERALQKLKKLTFSNKEKTQKILSQGQKLQKLALSLETRPVVKNIEETGSIPEFIRSRSFYDKHGFEYTEFRPCPYDLCKSFIVMIACNRLTVISDNVFDGHIRPVFTFYNIDTIPFKSQLDMYAKWKVKNKMLKSVDWVGNKDIVQLIVGDASGNIHRLDLQQRESANMWNAFKNPVKHIRCHKETNVIAASSTENEIQFYTIPDLDSLSNLSPPVLVAKCAVKYDILEMEWFGDRLVCITDNEFLEIQIKPTVLINQTKKLEKTPKKVDFKIVYTPAEIPSNKITTMKYYHENDCVLLQRRNGLIEEHCWLKKEKTHELNLYMLKSGRGFALHPKKRVLAVSSDQGTMTLLEYKTGREIQTIARRGKATESGKFMAWSDKFRDTLFMASKNRVVRYVPFGDRLVNSKPAHLSAFYEKGIPFKINFPAMDQTNVDHDHRAYQWFWGTNDEVSKAYTNRNFDQERENRKHKIFKLNARYLELIEENGETKLPSSIRKKKKTRKNNESTGRNPSTVKKMRTKA